MKEDFIQNIQFDVFSVELIIGETATLLLAENYVTIREVFVDGAKVEPNENKQIFLTSGGDDKQDTLVSGTNIKTINGESVLGSGNIEIQGGGSTDIISDDIISTTGVWSSNKTNEEINKLLPLIYAGL